MDFKAFCSHLTIELELVNFFESLNVSCTCYVLYIYVIIINCGTKRGLNSAMRLYAASALTFLPNLSRSWDEKAA